MHGKQHKCTQCYYVSSQADNLRYHIKTYFYKNQRNANGTTFLQSYNRNLPNICSSTLERRHINIRSADAHTAEGTSGFTLENSHTSTHNAFSQVPILVILNNTWRNTQMLSSFFSIKIINIAIIANATFVPSMVYFLKSWFDYHLRPDLTRV